MEPKKWKFISRKTILKHPRLHLVEDEVALPNGAKVPYLRESPAAQQSVTAIALNAKDEILLQREYSYPPDEVMWQLPGGKIEHGEDITIAANRELSEESGYVARETRILGYYYTNNRRSNQKQYVVLCTDLIAHKEKEDGEEFIVSSWASAAELKQKIRSGEIHNMNLLAAVNLWLTNADNHLTDGKPKDNPSSQTEKC